MVMLYLSVFKSTLNLYVLVHLIEVYFFLTYLPRKLTIRYVTHFQIIIHLIYLIISHLFEKSNAIYQRIMRMQQVFVDIFYEHKCIYE
jgi:hypothetical protein